MMEFLKPINGIKSTTLKDNTLIKTKIPLTIPSLSGNERKYLNQCIEEGFVSSVGPFVNQFENLLVEKTGAKHAIAVSSGTGALHISLIALGVKYNDLVIIPTFTFIATANAVSHCGAVPWLVDISLDDWGMDLNLLDDVLSQKTYEKDGALFHLEKHQKISAIIPVYPLGSPCDMEKWESISKKYNIPLVVDAAAGIGSTYNTKLLGSHGGDLITLSFNGNKNITSGGGGAVLTNNEFLAKKIRHLSTTARIGSDYDHDEVGYNYRMTNIEAAVGCAQLEQLDKFIERKKYVHEFYLSKFKNIPEISFFPITNNRTSSYWLSGIILQNNQIQELITCLKAENIEARFFWKPIHRQKPYLQCLKTTTENADYIWDKILILPCSSSIADFELERVCQCVLRFFKK